MTAEELEMFSEEGRFWAEKIFDAILFLARRCEATLGSFLENNANGLDYTYKVVDVVDTCERCLECLRPEVFFNEEASALPGTTQLSILSILRSYMIFVFSI